MKANASGDLPPLVEGFFIDRLMRQRHASPHTVASYRDTFRLLLGFAQKQTGKQPSAMNVGEIDTVLIGAFLDHLEKTRGNCARSRNARLAAIRSFFQYAALHEPTHSASIQRVLAIPSKRWTRAPIAFLTRPEVDALLAAPDQRAWIGRRDHTLLLVAVQTGLRASELTGLVCQDVVFGAGAHVRCLGKGRKERCTPLTRPVASALRRWLGERAGSPADAVFPSSRGGALSRDAVEYLVAKHVAAARRTCASLGRKQVSAHVLRHTTAMQLLQAGVDRSVIALWLGHESVETTQEYLEADLAMKEATVAKTAPLKARVGRFKPGDQLLAFLVGL
jgi:site-specific recombinase XerD